MATSDNTRALQLASFPGLPRFLFFGLRSVYYTERKLKKQKTEEAWKRGYLAMQSR